jgi:hypothetical protein
MDFFPNEWFYCPKENLKKWKSILIRNICGDFLREALVFEIQPRCGWTKKGT